MVHFYFIFHFSLGFDMITIILIFLLSFFPFHSLQDDCSFISGEGCLNGICKYCAMCITNDCILATPYSTGNNDGSTCAVTHQTQGYDFYNYCLSSGDDNDGGNKNKKREFIY